MNDPTGVKNLKTNSVVVFKNGNIKAPWGQAPAIRRQPQIPWGSGKKIIGPNFSG